jgi:hypothetical protein
MIIPLIRSWLADPNSGQRVEIDRAMAQRLLDAIEPTSIATVPKDGSLVDLFFEGGTRVTDCYYDLGWKRTEWHQRHGMRHSVVTMLRDQHPTHWMRAPQVYP